MMHKTITVSELQERLDKLGAKLGTHEVHALYLGALTSTALGLGPQKLLGAILGDAPMLGESLEDANAALGVLFGYWNTLVSERDCGKVRLLADEPDSASRDCLRAFAEFRRQELLWYVRGIDAGGDDPLQFGGEGRKLLERLAQASGIFELYAKMLSKPEPTDEAALQQARDLLVKTSGHCEQLISDLMDVSDNVRREAMATSIAMQGRKTDDGVQIARVMRVGRNEVCPCGSGKKWKRCCGSADRAN